MPVPPNNLTKAELKEWHEKEYKIWQTRYKNTFGTVAGQMVLADMLKELGFYDTIITEEDRILHNYAKRLLSHLGGYTCKVF